MSGNVSGVFTVDSSRGHLGQFEATLLQEGDGDLHAVVSRTLQQQSEHLQTQHLMSLRERREHTPLELNMNTCSLSRMLTSDSRTYHVLVDEMSHKLGGCKALLLENKRHTDLNTSVILIQLLNKDANIYDTKCYSHLMSIKGENAQSKVCLNSILRCLTVINTSHVSSKACYFIHNVPKCLPNKKLNNNILHEMRLLHYYRNGILAFVKQNHS